MTDALGRPNSVLVLGGTSDIALATAKRLADRGARTIALLGRHPEAMLAAAEPLREAGATVHALPFDASDPVGCVAAVEEAFRTYGDFDVVLLAFGILGDQQRYEADPEAAARDSIVNFAATVGSGLAVARRLRAQGQGTLVVLSSVAGQRPRRELYVYGAAKSGVDAFSIGLNEALRGSGARVMVVRPGYVQTKMTAHLPLGPMAQTVDDVADGIMRGLDSGAAVVWCPPKLRLFFAVLRLLPQFVFRRLGSR